MSLQRKAPMRRGGPLRRAGRLRPRSLKMARVYQQTRRALVAAILAAFPICQRCEWRRSVDVHELLPRGRGGSITDPQNCVAVCRWCHDWIGRCPAVAEAQGWLLPSGSVIVRPAGVPALGDAA